MDCSLPGSSNHGIFQARVLESGTIAFSALTLQEAKERREACPTCQLLTRSLPEAGINPHGLSSNELWQMDVTHYLPFKPFHFVCVTTDNIFRLFVGYCTTRRRSTSCASCLLECLAILGHPQTIKTDNAPSYTSHKLQDFFCL